jgi:hypothetical protein
MKEDVCDVGMTLAQLTVIILCGNIFLKNIHPLSRGNFFRT